MQDRFVKLMLVLIAALLVANLVKSNDSDTGVPIPTLISSAQAQSNNRRGQEETPTTYKVSRLEGYSVEDLQDVVSVGDGRSFVVSNTKGFMVYQVVPSR